MKTRTIKPQRTNYPIETIADKPYFPQLTFTLKDLPEAKGWEIGEDYKIELTVTMTGMTLSDSYDNVRFDIKKVGVEEEDVQ